jgi:hypothetical protein
MKKIKFFPKYIKIQKRRQRRALQTTRRSKLYSAINIYSSYGKLTYEQSGFKRITPPHNFSIVNNPDEMIGFLNKLKIAVYNGKKVVLDFSKVTDISNDGFIALLSVIQDSKVPNTVRVRAIKPKNLKVRKRLMECGISEESTGLESVVPKSGRFKQKSSLTADTEEANELIQFATRRLYGIRRTLKDVQRILGECIDNTTFHANPTKRLAEKWWGTVFYEEDINVAYFSILDNGIGIIESLKVNWIRDAGFLLKYKDNKELLLDIFQGGVLSSTGEANRGNGLPNIFRARERKQFSRLICLTNNVYIDFDNEDYRLLKNSFSGTFFYWEVYNNRSNSTAN